MAVDQERLGAGLFLIPGQVQFPFSLSYGLQMNAQVVKESLVRVCFFKLPVEEVADVLPVDDTVPWRFRAGKCSQGGEDVQGTGNLVTGGALGNPSRSPQHRGHAHPSFKGGYFSTS